MTDSNYNYVLCKPLITLRTIWNKLRDAGSCWDYALLWLIEAPAKRIWKYVLRTTFITFFLWVIILIAEIPDRTLLNIVKHLLDILLDSATYTAYMFVLNPVQSYLPKSPGLFITSLACMVRMLVLVLPMISAWGLMRFLFYGQIRPTLSCRIGRRWNGHVVIIGAGHTGLELIQYYLERDDKQKIMVVECTGYNQHYRTLMQQYGWGRLVWVDADARYSELLAPAMGVPSRIYVVTGADDDNLDILDALLTHALANPPLSNQEKTHQSKKSIATKEQPYPDTTEVLVRLRTFESLQALHTSLQTLKTQGRIPEHYWVHPLSVEALAARRAFSLYWPLQAAKEGRADIVLIGDSPFALQLLDQFARLAHFDPQIKTRLRWLVPPDSPHPSRMMARNSGLVSVANRKDAAAIYPVIKLEVQELDLPRLANHDTIDQVLQLASGIYAQRIFISSSNHGQDAWLAQLARRTLLRAGYDLNLPDAPKIVLVKERVDDPDLKNHAQNTSLWGHEPGIGVITVLRSAVYAIVDDARVDTLSMLLKQTYECSNVKEVSVIELYNLAQKTWAKESEENRWSNRDPVDHIILKIAWVMHECQRQEYQPLLLRLQWLSEEVEFEQTHGPLPRWNKLEFDELIETLKEDLQFLRTKFQEPLEKLEHQRWIAFKLAGGWKYCHQKNNASLQSSYLITYEDLEDNIKKYDRDLVDMIPILLEKMWELSSDWQKS